MAKQCNSLDEVRQNIDLIDDELVKLIAKRGRFVSQAARFKNSVNEVVSSDRTDLVIGKVRTLAQESGLNPSITEKVYRAMINAFTEEELITFDSRYKDVKESYY